ncbi:hypothetical protein SCHPADRAFT_939570 [Schizopora paradoxa]|uniref:Cyanovirin-N domain-containing protein n=1 Tax=Schizopora paradoxa TaxID=27342 RepID=A0A0H2RQX8_9AGAM|nr:hypothetical protein SCHPADRAFT_939570 [Schizopora paradoxa]
MKYSLGFLTATALCVAPMVLVNCDSSCGNGQIELGIAGSNQVIIFANDCGVIDETEPGQSVACNNGFVDGTSISCNNGFISVVTTPDGSQFGDCEGVAASACGISADAVCCVRL